MSPRVTMIILEIWVCIRLHTVFISSEFNKNKTYFGFIFHGSDDYISVTKL